MLDVTIENFEAEVVNTSMTTPVLVDFWAPWCGPCKSLGPVLERLEAEYGGRFKLAKINSDDQQQLASAFGIRSIPTCVLMVGGRPVDGFMGAQPEGQLREFLDKHLPSEGELIAEAETAEAEDLMAQGDHEAALAKLQEALAINPANDDARFDYVKLLITLGELETAETALAPALAQIPRQLRFEALMHWLQALQFATTDERGQWTLDQFDAALAANKRDFDTRLAKARLLLAAGQYEASMDELLEIIMRDKAWSDGLPRKIYIAILELLTPPAPKPDPTDKKAGSGIEIAGKTVAQQDPQAELVSRYRRKLSMALN
ncbi:MAG: thioredoxin [Alphaproteobacteria bacterium]|nr:thioredoxin [Alphaproteobacteria bacterium]